MDFDYFERIWTPLHDSYRQRRDHFPDTFRLRIHRALSWLQQAYLQQTDYSASCLNHIGHKPPHWTQIEHRLNPGIISRCEKLDTNRDMAFLALWIAFNAAYARDWEYAASTSERSNLRAFLQTICGLDRQQQLYRLVWSTYSGSIRLLLDNRYVFQPFWDYHNGRISEQAWLDDFARAKKKAAAALAAQDTEAVLALIFDRLYTLRNQMVHGGATYCSSANRNQVRDGCHFLNECIPAILGIMLQHPDNIAWGKPFYPFVPEH